MNKVVVFLPGIMGSELANSKGEKVWPGPIESLLFRYPEHLMQQLRSDDLHSTDIIRTYSISNEYQSLLDLLTECGFVLDQNLKLFHYDWRKDNRITADLLADQLDKIVKERGNDAEIILIAHSMGGLISRFYLESGQFNKRFAFSKVSTVVFLATPHRGAVEALPAALGQMRKAFLAKDQVAEIANDSRFPAVYQLMPPPDEPFAWVNAVFLKPYDVYQNIKVLGLNEDNVNSNVAMYKGLTTRAPNVRYFSFVGTRMKTISVAKVIDADPPQVLSHQVEQAGDGTVPSNSGASLIGVQMLAVRGEHSKIYKSEDLTRALRLILGQPGVLALLDVQRSIDVAIQPAVTEPEQDIEVALQIIGPRIQQLKGYLRVMLVDTKTNSEVFEAATIPIQYIGLDTDCLTMRYKAPAVSGLYRLQFFEENVEEPAGNSADLFVQETTEFVEIAD